MAVTGLWLPAWAPTERLAPAVKLAFVAARQAWGDAGFGLAKVPPERVGTIIGSSRGPIGINERVSGQRVRAVSAVYSAFSSIAGVIAAEVEAGQCALMLSATCVSGALALQHALFMLRAGEVDVALVGGVDAPLVDSLIEEFAAAGVLAEGADSLRPFDKDRTGTVLGEGAAFVVLEMEKGAVSRGAEIHGEIHAVATGCEPHLRSSMQNSARGMQATVRRALEATSLCPQDIDLLLLHGTGTKLNDRMESECVRDLFGEVAGQPYSLGSKAVTGHTLGASALFQLLTGLQAVRHEFIPGTANCAGLDPACPIRLSVGAGVSRKLRKGLCLTSGFWGNTSCVVFGKEAETLKPE